MAVGKEFVSERDARDHVERTRGCVVTNVDHACSRGGFKHRVCQ